MLVCPECIGIDARGCKSCLGTGRAVPRREMMERARKAFKDSGHDACADLVGRAMGFFISYSEAVPSVDCYFAGVEDERAAHAEGATQRDLEEIGQAIGCGHIEDGLVRCVRSTLNDKDEEVERLTAENRELAHSLANAQQQVVWATELLEPLKKRVAELEDQLDDFYQQFPEAHPEYNHRKGCKGNNQL